MLLWCWVFGDAYESDDFGQVGCEMRGNAANIISSGLLDQLFSSLFALVDNKERMVS